MPNTLKNMPAVTVLLTETEIYAAPAATTTIIQKITFTNIDTVSRWLTVRKFDDSGATTTDVIKEINIPVNNAFELTGEYLETLDSIKAIAETSTAFVATGSIVEQT